MTKYYGAKAIIKRNESLGSLFDLHVKCYQKSILITLLNIVSIENISLQDLIDQTNLHADILMITELKMTNRLEKKFPQLMQRIQLDINKL